MTTTAPSATPRPLAFIYDFDGTLCEGNLLDQHLLRELTDDPQAFWDESNEQARANQADRVCTYMRQLMDLCEAKGRRLSRPMLEEYGARGKLRAGLAGAGNWFARLEQKCDAAGLDAQHYVISSGLGEMIGACLAQQGLDGYFGGADRSHVFASRYFFDDGGFACAPAWTVNYTTKTQFVFRINKGKLKLGDDKAPNDHMEPHKRPVPFANMVFIGDGYSDIPCFSLIKHQGGFALAVLAEDTRRPASLRQIETLVADDRVDAISLLDPFVADSCLERQIDRIIDWRGAGK